MNTQEIINFCFVMYHVTCRVVSTGLDINLFKGEKNEKI
jgi:hypothetical protein